MVFVCISKMKTCSIRPIVATNDNFAPYGNLFYDLATEKIRLEKWPKHIRGWRNIEDGIGGGETSGEFELEWKDGKHYASNSGVSNGDYCFANLTDDGKIQITNEINYHACGSQLFFSPHFPLILLVAKIDEEDRYPDDIRPNDFVAFLVPPMVGIHLNSYVYHCPPILHPSNKKATVWTKQARVHSKIYYNPLEEDKTIFEIYDF